MSNLEAEEGVERNRNSREKRKILFARAASLSFPSLHLGKQAAPVMPAIRQSKNFPMEDFSDLSQLLVLRLAHLRNSQVFRLHSLHA